MRALAWIALLSALLGCSAPSTTTVSGTPGGCKGANCGHTSVAGGSSSGTASRSGQSGSSSGSASSSIGTASTAGSNSASTTAVGSSTSSGSSSSQGGQLGVCQTFAPPDGGGCAASAISSELLDILSCAFIAGGTVDALDANGVPTSATATSGADGGFVLCGPAGTAYSPSVTATGYPVTYYPEVQADSYTRIDYIIMLENTFFGTIADLAPTTPSTSLGTVIATVNAKGSCLDTAGWTISLTQPDGGGIADGGYVVTYLGAESLPDPRLTATSAGGVAFLYNIDLSSGNFFALTASNPDAGVCTPLLVGGESSFTGRLYVTSNALSFYPLNLQ